MWQDDSFTSRIRDFKASITAHSQTIKSEPAARPLPKNHSRAPPSVATRRSSLILSDTQTRSFTSPSLSILSASTVSQTYSVLSVCLAKSTMDKYGSGLAAFQTFCDSEQVPQASRLPADEFLLCAFAASKAGSMVRSTVQNLISAVRAWHIVNGAPWNGGLRLAYIMNGIEALAPSGKPPRAPVTHRMLELVCTEVDISSNEGLCVRAAAATAFWCQLRLGEIFATSRAVSDQTNIPSRDDLSYDLDAAGSMQLRLPWTKTKRHKGETIIVTRQCGSTDPISALHHHIQSNRPSAFEPLFSFRTPNGSLSCLTKKRFLSICNKIWSSHGLPHTTGHSFRIGGTTELLMGGVDPDVVKTMGRWSSDAFLRYWRALEVVVPLHAERLRAPSTQQRPKALKSAITKKRVRFADARIP
ncbi:hypothetical protein EVJ58_g2058 [Rhodofomes roseus]|uniref:DNA breaking-rejoining enzyme n=1 Tax=Rhodofomes roseus TaxID=34475 RepID=A0A4Y9YUT0_9APHY|nr:hypothetical protein EVJ58_g2058 [Rhodofomes roseus]